MKSTHILLFLCFAVLVLTVHRQGNTIAQQRQLIREMTRNPQCLIAEGEKQ
jgi:hypothetical protein